MTGCRLTSSMPAMMRSLSSCFDATRMCLRTERANLEKKPSMRLSQEPCLGVKVKVKRPRGRESSPSCGFSRDVCRMIVEDQLDSGVGRISGVEKLEEFDELAAAVAVADECMDLAIEQVDPSQQTERAMTFTREGRVNAGHRWQIWRRRCDDLNSRLLVVGDDRHRLIRFVRLGGSLLQHLNLAVDAQNLRHLLLERGVAAFQIVAHLVRLEFFLAKDLAHRALNQVGKTFVPGRRSALARMVRQQPCRPQLVRIAMLLGFIASQRHQPSLRLQRDGRLLTGAWPVIKCAQYPVGKRPFDATLDGLMMNTKLSSDQEKRRVLTVREQHLRPLHPARRLGSRAGNNRQLSNLLIGHRQFDRLPPSCHVATPRPLNRDRGIHQLTTSSMTACFMESIV